MFNSVGNEVSKLHRLSTEDMILDNYEVELGKYCEISIEEINQYIFNDTKTV